MTQEKRGPGRPRLSEQFKIKEENKAILDENLEVNLTERPAEVLLDQMDKDPWSGLTDRQRTIQELKLRGLSQKAIGTLVGISQTMVFKELAAIKEVHKQKGATLDTQTFAGETISIYEELQIRALKTYDSIPADNNLAPQMKLQAINTIASIREKMMKALGDLGIIQRAAQKIEHEHSLKQQKPSFVDSWDKKAQEKLAVNILTAGFTELEDPLPPEEEPDIVTEGVVIEEKVENE